MNGNPGNGVLLSLLFSFLPSLSLSLPLSPLSYLCRFKFGGISGDPGPGLRLDVGLATGQLSPPSLSSCLSRLAGWLWPLYACRIPLAGWLAMDGKKAQFLIKYLSGMEKSRNMTHILYTSQFDSLSNISASLFFSIFLQHRLLSCLFPPSILPLFLSSISLFYFSPLIFLF